MSCRHSEGVKVYLCSFLTSALEGVGVQRHASDALPLEESPVTHCTVFWVGPTGCVGECG
jgi:hypothetical protein